MRGSAILMGILLVTAGVRASRADCRKTCQAGETRDGHGCCIAAKATGKQSIKPKAKKPKKPTGARTSGTGASTGSGTGTGSDTAVADPPPPPPRSQGKRSTDDLIDACRGKEAAACRELASRDDSAIDPGTYAEVMAIGCDLDQWSACTELGAKAEKGAGVKQDFNRARTLYKKACDHRELGGCHRLGQVYFLALGVVKDIDLARSLFGKACDGGMIGACSDLGYLEENQGNYQEAVKLYLRACDLGSGVACGNAAILFENASDYTTAATLYKKACDLGRTDMCGR